MSSRRPPRRLTRAELHSHSTASDGEHTPGVLAELCARRGVEVLSLTDHDSVAGVVEAAQVCSVRGVTFLPGIEVSAQEGRSVHVLGYGVSLEDEGFVRALEQRNALRHSRMDRMIARACELGYEVTRDEVDVFASSGNPGRPHLARALVARGHVHSIEAAFDRFLADGMPMFVPSPWPSVEQAIAEIHSAGGVAVLAHPVHYGLDDRIDAWIEAGLDGIEVRHPSHTTEDAGRYYSIASRAGLLKTASSDYHGPSVKAGQVLGETFVETEWVDALLERCGIERETRAS